MIPFHVQKDVDVINQIQHKYPMAMQVWHFIMHLRWHYQLFILSGGFLLGGFLSDIMNWQLFLLQFANVHLLLFGGATAYNSYWDKDTGSIGGLRRPPHMEPWMWTASLLLQALGMLIALGAGITFGIIYVLSALFFWLYSTPLARWKGKPLKSLVAIGVSTGTNSLLMGYLAAGNSSLSDIALLAAVGVALVMLSLYPVSQVYQMDEDAKRGDNTFAIRYGAGGVARFFNGAFSTGMFLIFLALLQVHFWLAHGFAATGMLLWFWVRNQLRQLGKQRDDYQKVMWIKLGTSIAFVCFLIAALMVKHTSAGPALGLQAVLR